MSTGARFGIEEEFFIADSNCYSTPRGSLKLAHFVEKEIRKDLNLAKLERNIPLAGSEDEQSKVMGRAVAIGQPADPSLKDQSAEPDAEAACPSTGAFSTQQSSGTSHYKLIRKTPVLSHKHANCSAKSRASVRLARASR